MLARELGWKFDDADDFHSPENIEKMRSGRPLTDQDRQSWLHDLRALIEHSLSADENTVLACSALKKKYRDQLRAGPNVLFIYLHGTRARIEEQLKQRRGHFFDPKLLEAQFADLEEPESSADALTVDLSGEPRDVVEKIKTGLRGREQ